MGELPDNERFIEEYKAKIIWRRERREEIRKEQEQEKLNRVSFILASKNLKPISVPKTGSITRFGPIRPSQT